MFLAFSDESGCGDLQVEPILVVAAFVINPDTAWNDVTCDMASAVKDWVQKERQRNFEFKARELFSHLDRPGNKAMVTALAKIPANRYLTVYYGAVHRQGFIDRASKLLVGGSYPHKLKPDDWLELTQALAFSLCATRLEAAFRQFLPEEKVLWIADNVKAANSMATCLRRYQGTPLISGMEGTQLEHIADTIFFGDSKTSGMLQLADFFNYVISGWLMKKPKVLPYFELMKHQTTWPGFIWDDPRGQITNH